MKVADVLHPGPVKKQPVSEEQVVSRLSSLDWRYEFSEDFRKIAAGQREMQVAENVVYQFWKTNPSRAIQLWNEHCPFAREDKSIVPSFIYRMQANEGFPE